MPDWEHTGPPIVLNEPTGTKMLVSDGLWAVEVAKLDDV